jgi:hypothetical protein
VSTDTLLNSKNEYIQNCISRITVKEDKLTRKRSLMGEEAEKKEHEEKFKEFKKPSEQPRERQGRDLKGGITQ